MKALILNGLDPQKPVYNSVKSYLVERLNQLDYQSKWLDLCKRDIRHCSGCSYCSYEEPGVCALKDDMQEIFPLMATSELQIFLSPISFGGFNSELKKAIDRYSVLGLPTYTIHQGELHHPARYSNPQSFMAIGILKEDNQRLEQSFQLVAERFAICSFAERAATIVLKECQEPPILEGKISQGLKEMGLIL